MIVLGLPGSIGMGKSTVARMFEEEGVPVFDADAVVHRLQGREGALVAEIESHFPGTTGSEGVDRTALAEAVLGDSEALQRLEALIHPPVAVERQAFLERHKDAPLVVLDIPLLFEKGGADKVDRIAVVALRVAPGGGDVALAGPVADLTRGQATQFGERRLRERKCGPQCAAIR